MEKRVPTDEELNMGMAKACGWKWYCNAVITEHNRWIMFLPPYGYLEGLAEVDDHRDAKWVGYERGLPSQSLRDYTGDRNLLPEILSALEVPNSKSTLVRFGKCLIPGKLEEVLIIPNIVHTIPYVVLRASMREIVIAALKATGRWTDEWIDGDKSEQAHEERTEG